MSASLNVPGNMTIAEFLDRCPDDGQRWQLVDGTPLAGLYRTTGLAASVR